MFRILSLFDFEKNDCDKAPEALSQRLYVLGTAEYGVNN